MFHHLLIIDDDNRIRSLLAKYLHRNEFIVSTAEDTPSARELMKKYLFDLMIVDYMLPRESGVEFIAGIRKRENVNDGDYFVPVIMLTALGEVENRLEGLSVGADDYLAKPFEPQELVLRINSLLRRSARKQEDENGDGNMIKFGDFTFDSRQNMLHHGVKSLDLSEREMKLLKIFLENRNVVLSREELCRYYGCVAERTIDVLVTRLRQIIEKDSKNPFFLKTVRNGGYVFAE